MLAEQTTQGLPARYGPAITCHHLSKYVLDQMDERGPYPIGPQSDPEPATAQWHLPPVCLPVIPLQAALAGRRSERDFTPEPLGLQSLANLLGGAMAESRHPDGRYWVRPYPSAGARYPISVTLWARSVEGVEPGFYRYEPRSHGLVAVAGESFLGALLPPGPPEGLAGAPLWLVLTASLPRMASKYGLRAYRFTLQEAGHLAQNLQLIATGLGLSSLVVGAYLDDEVHAALGLDGESEVALALMPIGLGRRG